MADFDPAAARARCNAATGGPWVSWHGEPTRGALEHAGVQRIGREGVASIARAYVGKYDAEFIAHARTDLPAALDEIDRLTAAMDKERQKGDYLARMLQGSAYDAKDVALLAAERDALRAQVEAVRALHPLHTRRYGMNPAGIDIDTPVHTCGTCYESWPCATVRALSPAEEAPGVPL